MEERRAIFSNIRKFLRYLLSSNIGVWLRERGMLVPTLYSALKGLR